MDNKDDLHQLIEKVTEKESKSRKYVAYLSFIPALIGILILVFVSKKIYEAREELDETNKALHWLDQAKAKSDSTIKANEEIIDEYEDTLVVIEKRLFNTLQKVEKSKETIKLLEVQESKLKSKIDKYKWTPLDYRKRKGLNKNEIERHKNQCLDADEILTSQKFGIYYGLDKDVSIRYYFKDDDEDRVKEALKRSGFNDTYFWTEDWDKFESNRICFYTDVNIEYVKFLALNLIRDGVVIKKITYYSENTLKNLPQKSNSIEILGEKKLKNLPPMTVEDVMNLKEEPYE